MLTSKCAETETSDRRCRWLSWQNKTIKHIILKNKVLKYYN